MRETLREKLLIVLASIFPEIATFTALSIKIPNNGLDVFPPIVNFEPAENLEFFVIVIIAELLFTFCVLNYLLRSKK